MSTDVKKVVVTGGAGFIGSNLVDVLCQLGHDVHVIDNLSFGKRESINPKATLHVRDVRENCADICKGAEWVFHLAAMPRIEYAINNPVGSHGVNVNGTLQMLDSSAKANVKRFVFSSSCAVYGKPKIIPVDETAMVSPINPYSLHKAENELQCKVWSDIYGLETVSLRYFNVYGPRMDDSAYDSIAVAIFLRQKKEGKPLTITGDGNQIRDFIHVRDVVKANLLAAQSDKVGKGEAINIGSGKSTKIIDLANMIGGKVEFISARKEIRNMYGNSSKAKELLGWEPEITLESGIAGLLKTL